MIVKAFEQGSNKIYMRADNMDNFSVLVINGDKSQRIASTKNNHVDFDTASELFDFFVDKAQKNDHNETELDVSNDAFDKIIQEMTEAELKKGSQRND